MPKYLAKYTIETYAQQNSFKAKVRKYVVSAKSYDSAEEKAMELLCSLFKNKKVSAITLENIVQMSPKP